MNNRWFAGLIAATMSLGTVACMQENPANDKDGKNELAVAARDPIGSTQPITLIRTLADLRAMTTTGNYRLANNIDASPTSTTPFVPIGYTKDPFQGTFDGNNFTIDKLTVKGGTGEYAGMFLWAVNAKFQNIRLTNVNVSGGHQVGGLVGYARNVDLTYSYVTGSVTGNLNTDSRLGMVFGAAGQFVRVSRCYATGTVSGWGRYVGGFVGYVESYGTSDPNDEFRATFQEVFTNVTVNPSMPSSGSVYAGGLAGYVIGGWFESVHTVGSVTGRNAAGGILGYVVNDNANSAPSVLRGAMSRGIVTDAAVAGRAGTIGMSTGTFAWCSSFWDTNTDGGVPNPAMPEKNCQTGKSSSELKSPHPDPSKLISPYIFGQLVTQTAINQGIFDQCKLASGSDGDWGFGTCGTTQTWALNSNTEYNTLTRIPNPGVQPK